MKCSVLPECSGRASVPVFGIFIIGSAYQEIATGLRPRNDSGGRWLPAVILVRNVSITTSFRGSKATVGISCTNVAYR